MSQAFKAFPLLDLWSDCDQIKKITLSKQTLCPFVAVTQQQKIFLI